MLGLVGRLPRTQAQIERKSYSQSWPREVAGSAGPRRCVVWFCGERKATHDECLCPRRSAPRRLTTTGSGATKREQLDERSAQANYRSMSPASSSSSIISLVATFFVRFLDFDSGFRLAFELLRFPAYSTSCK